MARTIQSLPITSTTQLRKLMSIEIISIKQPSVSASSIIDVMIHLHSESLRVSFLQCLH